MYSYIKGTVEEINLDYIVIDNNNIGYKINVSSNTKRFTFRKYGKNLY